MLRIGENLLGAYVTGSERKLTFALVLMFAILVMRPQACSTERRFSVSEPTHSLPRRACAHCAYLLCRQRHGWLCSPLPERQSRCCSLFLGPSSYRAC